MSSIPSEIYKAPHESKLTNVAEFSPGDMMGIARLELGSKENPIVDVTLKLVVTRV